MGFVLPKEKDNENESICHLCYRRQTPFILTYSEVSTQASLPVCSRCIPPWINASDDGWWFDKRTAGALSRPNPDEISKAMKDRYDTAYAEHKIDIAVKRRCERRNYQDKFQIKQLVSHWDEDNRTYDFPATRPVWIEQLNSYLLL